ncbi:MAG: fumarylacetoacetate hydrolase family protein [Acidobacteria bacterium]|nr:fumarylacetoacetate hydrolase family protein [Acidobacteriota bacterium]
MRLCTIEHQRRLRTCAAAGGALVDLDVLAQISRRAGIGFPDLSLPVNLVEAASQPHRASLGDSIRATAERRPELAAMAEEQGWTLFHDPETAAWKAPVPAPGKIICVGLNYRDHAEEQNAPLPEEPLLFAKFANTLRGHREAVELPEISRKVDLEAELGFVIGRRGRRISEAEAPQYVLGYTIVNDVSARDLQARDRQWFRAKSCDGFAPMGPCLVTADEVPDPMGLKIESRLNDFVMQSSNTRNLIFDVFRLVSFISKALTLEPGDIISTGTPAGVGVFRNPPIFLKEGDRMKISIEILGELENPVVAPGQGASRHGYQACALGS